MRTQLLAGSLVVIFCLGLVACSDDDSAVTCGDNVAAGTEICDGVDLRSNDCTTIGQGFTGGTLACNSTCDGWDTTACTGGATCGNGTVEGNEVCDGADLDGNDCTTIGGGFDGGTLACNATCDGWVTTACTGGPTCGDGTAEGLELCDGLDLTGQDCTTIGGGFDGGTLACNTTCDGWDTTACTSPVCGDGNAEGNELCDGADLDGYDCADVGPFNGGTLACNANCQLFDYSGCTLTNPACGNGVQEGTEHCDGNDLGGVTCLDLDSGFIGGTLACNANCQYDLSGCDSGIAGWTCNPAYYAGGPLDGCDCGCGIIDIDCAGDMTVAACDYCGDFGSCDQGNSCPGFIDPADNSQCTGATATCGDNVAEGDEWCDGPDLRWQNCTTIGLGFAGGTLSCAGCQFDTSQCTDSVCGNNTQEGFEWCDGTDLNGYDCVTLGLGFSGGTLDCDATCNYDTSQCTMPVCGDNVAEGNEHCDGNDLDGNDCTTVSGGFVGGTLNCYATCSFDTSQCTMPICGDGAVEGLEECDDGNTTPGDGCDANCMIEWTFTTETEPNDVYTTANGPFTVSIQVTAAIGVAVDFDYFAVTVPAGGTITAEVTDGGTGDCATFVLDSEVKIYDTDGTTPLAFNDDTVNDLCSLASLTGLAAGTYFVRAASSQFYAPTDTFNYVLTIAVY